MTYGRLAQLVEHLLDVQEVTGSSPVPSTMHKPLTEVSGFFCTIRGLMLVYRELGTRTARPRRRRGNQSPSRALISARFPTRRNVYQERCRQTIRSGDFFVAEVTGRGPERAKAGYHHYDGILPFVR